MPTDGVPLDPARIQHKWSMFLELMRWTEGGSCRHDAILRYFGDEAETLSGCGNCDNCSALGEPEEADQGETATIVRKALSAVARTHARFGIQAAVKLLAGVADPRLERSGLHQSRTFGALKEKNEEWLMALLRRCVTAGWVDFTPGERPMVLLTPAGKTVLFATGPVRLLLPPEQIASRDTASHGAGSGRATGRRRRNDTPATMDPAATALFDALRARRLELARSERVPPYVIASDRTLREMAEFRPRSIRALEGVFGIGPAKAAKYGEALLEVVRES